MVLFRSRRFWIGVAIGALLMLLAMPFIFRLPHLLTDWYFAYYQWVLGVTHRSAMFFTMAGANATCGMSEPA